MIYHSYIFLSVYIITPTMTIKFLFKDFKIRVYGMILVTATIPRYSFQYSTVISVESVIYTEIIFSPFSVPRMSSRSCARRSSYSYCIMQRIVLQIQSSFGYFYRRQPRQRRETGYFYAV